MSVDNPTPWIPDHPSLAPDAADLGEDTDDYPVTRTGAQVMYTSGEYSRETRSEDFWEGVELVGGGLGSLTIGGVGISWLMSSFDSTVHSLPAELGIFTLVLFGSIAAGATLGAAPGHLVKKSAKRKRLERKNTSLRIGDNTLIRETWGTLCDHVDESDDVLWDIWEDLTDLADEAAHQRNNVGPAQLQVYNDSIADLAAKITRLCEERDATAVDNEEILAELTAPADDDELADLLQQRLTDKARMWDRIAPDDTTKENRS